MKPMLYKAIGVLGKGLKSFFSYFIPEKVFCISFSLYMFYSLISKPALYAQNVTNYIFFVIILPFIFYWIIALLTKKRRLKMNMLKTNRRLAKAIARQEELKARNAALREELLLALGLDKVDAMDGREFEEYAVWLLRSIGFNVIQHLGGSGDQGVDVIAEKSDIKYAVQCKCYARDLDNTPVQEVAAGKNHHGCHIGVVLTNRRFTPGAIALAKSNNVLLWDRDELAKMIALAKGTPARV